MKEIEQQMITTDRVTMNERRQKLLLIIGIVLCLTIWIATPPGVYIPYTNNNNNNLNVNNTIQYDSVELNYVETTDNIISVSEQIKNLPLNDYHKLIDLNDFEFMLQQSNCSNDDGGPLLLTLIHSAPINWRKRDIIRSTWGTKESRMRLYFLIGDVNRTELKYQLLHENELYGDLIQGNFIDSYRNMTYKHTMALKWFTYHCPTTKFLLKLDDDVFINMPLLLNMLENNKFKQNKLLYCHTANKGRVFRTYRSKWRVSYKEYQRNYYPSYCFGYFILYSPDVAFTLYRETQNLPYFWIDDVHVTGDAAEKANISSTHLNTTAFIPKLKIIDLLNNWNDPISIEQMKTFIFSGSGLSERDSKTLWSIIREISR